MAKKSVEEQIIEVLDGLRPYLNSDGGDIEFLEYQDGVVFVKLIGACGHCPHKNETMQHGILASLKDAIPEITDVINVEL